jgi:very-short-patch-repair endonuclease
VEASPAPATSRKEVSPAIQYRKYVVDFFCPECNLAVELDGASHYSILREGYETERTQYLDGLGVRIVRFENRWVFENIEGVLETIREAVREMGSGV